MKVTYRNVSSKNNKHHEILLLTKLIRCRKRILLKNFSNWSLLTIKDFWSHSSIDHFVSFLRSISKLNITRNTGEKGFQKLETLHRLFTSGLQFFIKLVNLDSNAIHVTTMRYHFRDWFCYFIFLLLQKNTLFTDRSEFQRTCSRFWSNGDLCCEAPTAK